MNSFQYALVVGSLLGASSAARADLSLSGAVGLPLNPTAQTLDAGKFAVEGNYFRLGNLSALGTDVSKVKSYGVHVAGTLGRLELSGGFNALRASDPANLGVDDLDRTGLSIGAKFLITRADEEGNGLNTAFGVGYDRATFDNSFLYLAASKPLPVYEGFEAAGMVHLGLRYDRFSTENIGGPKSTKLSVYGGVELPITPRGELAIVAEIGSKNNDLGRERVPYSAGIRYGKPSGVSASVGVQRQGVTGDGGVYAKVGFTFGG